MTFAKPLVLVALGTTSIVVFVALLTVQRRPLDVHAVRHRWANLVVPPRPADRPVDRKTVEQDRRLADKLFEQAVAYRANDPSDHRFLAARDDALGNAKGAFQNWKQDLHGGGSDRDDPAILVHYGELAIQFSTREEAEWAFRLAVAHEFSFVPAAERHVWTHSPSFSELRAAAHYAAGKEAGRSLLDLRTEIKEMRLAVLFNSDDLLAKASLQEDLGAVGQRPLAPR
jgi:hypothetical protein